MLPLNKDIELLAFPAQGASFFALSRLVIDTTKQLLYFDFGMHHVICMNSGVTKNAIQRVCEVTCITLYVIFKIRSVRKKIDSSCDGKRTLYECVSQHSDSICMPMVT